MDQPALSAALAATPEVVSILLAEHTPDRDGRCRKCRDRTAAPKWPCRLHDLAAAAQDLIDNERDPGGDVR